MHLQLASRPPLVSPPRSSEKTNRRRARRRGTALVEFAAVAPVFFLFLFAMFEFGRLVMVEQVLTNAAREGARRAILEQTAVADVTQAVNDYLAAKTISGATVAVAPDQLDKAGFGDPVTVTVAVPYGAVSWPPTPRSLALKIWQGNSWRDPIKSNGDFSLNAGEVYDLPPGTYYLRNVTLNGGATLNLSGPTTIYVTGTFRREGGCYVSNNTQLPKNLQILSTGGTIDVSSDNPFYGVIYALQSRVAVNGNADLFGAVVG